MPHHRPCGALVQVHRAHFAQIHAHRVTFATGRSGFGKAAAGVTITRARIQVRSVRSRLEGDDVGFIRVTQFNEQTTEGLKKAITDLSAQAGDKLKGYVVDLRNNPGGLLDQALSVSDAFLERGEIVSTRSRNAEETQRSPRAGVTSLRTSQSSC
jgi:C-terminal processing protease CtpA/Prc